MGIKGTSIGGDFDMTDNAEEGIARVQLAQKDGLGKHHKSGVDYMDDRIFIYLSALVLLGLIAIWATATSPIIIYGSFAAVVLVAVLIGVLKIRRIHKIREQRELQIKEFRSGGAESS